MAFPATFAFWPKLSDLPFRSYKALNIPQNGLHTHPATRSHPGFQNTGLAKARPVLKTFSNCNICIFTSLKAIIQIILFFHIDTNYQSLNLTQNPYKRTDLAQLFSLIKIDHGSIFRWTISLSCYKSIFNLALSLYSDSLLGLKPIFSESIPFTLMPNHQMPNINNPYQKNLLKLHVRFYSLLNTQTKTYFVVRDYKLIWSSSNPLCGFLFPYHTF